MKNIRTDLDYFADIWDKALKDGVFKDAPKPPEPNRDSDFFGQWDGSEEVPMNECDAKYWARVYNLSKGTGPGAAPDPLREDAVATKDRIKKVSDRIANSANPIYPGTVGKDQDVKATRNWTDGPELQELAQLKVKLEKLESQMNAQEGLGKNGSSVQKQIDALRTKLDDLSDSLTNSRYGRDDDNTDN